MKQSLKKLSTFCLAMAFLTGGLAWAEDQKNPPIHIEADRMESDQKKDAVHFIGNVVAKQGDLQIKADDMKVYYNSKELEPPLPEKNPKELVPGAQKIKNLLAEGNVEIVNQGYVATGDKVDYQAQERKVILTGNTKVWQDNNMVTGEKIVLYLDEGKSIVERSSENGERVKAFFYPETEKKPSAGPDDPAPQ